MCLCKLIFLFYIITVCQPPGAISCVVEAGSITGSGSIARGRAGGAGAGAGAGHVGTTGAWMEGRDGTGSIAEGRAGFDFTRGHAKALLISSTKLRVTGHRLLPSVVEKNNTTEGNGGT